MPTVPWYRLQSGCQADGPGDEPTEPLRADAFRLSCLAEVYGDPVTVDASDDAQGDQHQQGTWLLTGT
jgi:hypothetical protein